MSRPVYSPRFHPFSKLFYYSVWFFKKFFYCTNLIGKKFSAGFVGLDVFSITIIDYIITKLFIL